MTGFDDAEYRRWLSQANHTRDSAGRDAASGDYSWSCFKSQQAGEYALQALLRGLGQPAHGHALRRLLSELMTLSIEVPEAVMEAGQALDRHIVPTTRYADAFPEGSPHEYYNLGAAEEALGAADKVIDWVQSAA
ncbi:MAG: HEPN domain-containing protein [Trueperaceae bacterium]